VRARRSKQSSPKARGLAHVALYGLSPESAADRDFAATIEMPMNFAVLFTRDRSRLHLPAINALRPIRASEVVHA
jgi:hypothetical protein